MELMDTEKPEAKTPQQAFSLLNYQGGTGSFETFQIRNAEIQNIIKWFESQDLLDHADGENDDIVGHLNYIYREISTLYKSAVLSDNHTSNARHQALDLPRGAFPTNHYIMQRMSALLSIGEYDRLRGVLAATLGEDIVLDPKDKKVFLEEYESTLRNKRFTNPDQAFISRIAREILESSQNEKLENLQKAVLEKQGFTAMDKLWGELITSHRLAYYLYGIAFYGGAAAVVLFLIFNPQSVTVSLLERNPLAGTIATPEVSTILLALLEKVFVFALPTVLIVWGLRMFSRQYLYNIALCHDAQLRKAVTDAYLTIKAENEIKDTAVDLIMMTIFGPRTPPAVKDGSPIEAITEIANGVKETARDFKPGKKK